MVVDVDLRESYQKVFFGIAEPTDKKRVFCDLLSQTGFLSSSTITGETPEAAEARRSVGLYMLSVLGLAPSNKEDIFESMQTLVGLFAQNKSANETLRRTRYARNDS